jgi:hypothetical protein
MLIEKCWREVDGAIRRRVEEQLELTTWKSGGDRFWQVVLREWPTSEKTSKQGEDTALSARPRATYKNSAASDGALATEWLSW